MRERRQGQPHRVGPLERVFFDLDGTLLHNPVSFPTVFRETLAEHGVASSEGRVRQAIAEVWPWYDANVGRWREDEAGFWVAFNTRVGRAAGAGGSAAAFGEAVTARFGVLDRPRLFHDVMACLDALRNGGIRLGVVTARPDARRILRPLGILHRFDYIGDAFTTGSAKQDARSFRHALSATGTDARAALHVGDQFETDVRPAEAAGIHAVLLDRRGEADDVPCTRFPDLDEFTRWLAPLIQG